MRDEKFHHRDAHSVERRAHERRIAPLMHIRPVLDHPLRYLQSLWARRSPRDTALGRPGERTTLAIAERSLMQCGVASHESFDAIDVIDVDRLLEAPDLLE